MMKLTSIPEAEQLIADNRLSFIYIARSNCGVCHALLPQVKKMLEEFPLIKQGHINADELEEIAGHFSVFTVPVLLFFVDGKEMIREARFVHMEALREKVGKIYHMRTDQ